jgi:hypothetical protein
VELYDLAADPHEIQNQTERNPSQVAHLRGLIDAWWNGND